MSWLIRTKLSPPLLSGGLEREQLKKRLGDCLNGGVNTVFLSAPAGYGKSTLLSQWLGTQEQRFCWYSFDSADDAARLARHLAEALRQIELWEPLVPPGLEPTLSVLSKESTAIIVVIDDLHLNTDPQIHSFVEQLVNNLSPNSSLILSSREAPPPYLTRFFPKDSFEIWNSRDLCLTKNETKKLLQLSGIRLKPDSLNALFDQTEGWAAVVQLLCLTNPRKKAWEKLIHDLPTGHGGMWEYLANEILSALDQETQHRVMRLSLLQRFNRFVAHSLNADIDLYIKPSWGPFLVELEDELDPGWFRFHHLLGHFLKQLAELHFSETEKRELHVRASIWFEENGYFEEAVQQSLAARDLDRAQALLSSEDAIERIVHHYSTAQHWFEVLPQQRINNSWLLCTNLGTVYGLLGRLGEAKDFFQRALEDESCEEVYLCLSGLAFCQAGLGQQRTSEEYLNLALAQERALGPSKTLGQLFIASVGLYRGDAHDALQSINRAIEASNLKSIVVEASCALVKAHALFYRGLLQESVQAIDGFLERLKQAAAAQKLKRLNDKSAAAWGLRARVTSQMGLWSEAEAAWENFDKARQTHGIPHFSPPLICAKVRYLIRRKRLLAAREYLNRHIHLGGKIGICLLRAAQADLLHAEGQTSKALGLLNEWMRELGQQEPPAFYHQGLYVARLRCLLAQSDPAILEGCLSELAEMGESAQRDGRIWDKIHFLSLSAEFSAKLGNIEGTQNFVDEALALGRPLGFVEVFLDDSIVGDFARSRDKDLSMWNSPRASHPKLDARELEILQLMREGLSDQEIADRIFLGLHTVKWHNRRIYKKLGVRRRTQALKVFEQSQDHNR